MKIIIPMAGRGTRFANKTVPKPFLPVAGKPMVAWTLASIRQSLPHHDPADIIFITLKEHEEQFHISTKIKSLTSDTAKIISIPHITDGPVCTVLAAMPLLAPDEDFFTVDCDQYFVAPTLSHSINRAREERLAGLIPVWISNNPAYSYIRSNSQGIALETAEKKIISDQAAVGIYYFGSRTVYEQAAHHMIKKRIMTKNEFYMCPLYNIVIQQGGKVRTARVKKWMTMGTPEELVLFETKMTAKT